METIVLILHVMIAVAMTGFILLQQGKGAEMGASFGAGASQTVFGSAGSAGFLTKATAVLALLFFVTSITLAIFAKKKVEQPLSIVVPAAAQVPAAPANADVPAAAASQPVSAPAAQPAVAVTPAAPAVTAPVPAAPAAPTAPVHTAPVVRQSAKPAPVVPKPDAPVAESPAAPAPAVAAPPAPVPAVEPSADSSAGASNP